MRLLNLPNSLTLLRIALVPLMVLFFYIPWEYARLCAFLVFIIASLTDWLDGVLARAWAQETDIGAILDPVADKIIVITALILLVEQQASAFFTIVVILIICREVLISLAREWAATRLQQKIKVSLYGKFKTGFQMVGLGFLLYFTKEESFYLVGIILLYIAAVLAIVSLFLYLKTAFSLWQATHE